MIINFKDPEQFILKQWTDFIHLNKPYNIIVTEDDGKECIVLAQIPMIQKIAFNEFDVRLTRKVLITEPATSITIDADIESVNIEKQRNDIIMNLKSLNKDRE